MIFLFQILIAWLLADFLTGFIHWFEDRYMDSFTLNFLNAIAEENGLHHRKPTAMLINSGWVNMRSAAAVGWPLAVLLWAIGLPMWIYLVPFFSAFGNLIHRWAHVPARQLPRWIRGMQEFGLFISREHHDSHHRSMDRLIPKHIAGYRFCPMTDWVNPVIDRIKLWPALETIFAWLGLKTTVQRRGH